VLRRQSGWGPGVASFVDTEYAATDPRDHKYGLLGITGLDIVLDHGVPTMAEVYRDFVRGFLRPSRHMPWNALGHPFRFLSAVGIGCCENDPGVPTWLPNFHQQSAYSSILVPPECQMADQNVFMRNDCYATIRENSLYAYGLVLGPIECLTAC
jgi:hypothetical protein